MDHMMNGAGPLSIHTGASGVLLPDGFHWLSTHAEAAAHILKTLKKS